MEWKETFEMSKKKESKLGIKSVFIYYVFSFHFEQTNNEGLGLTILSAIVLIHLFQEAHLL